MPDLSPARLTPVPRHLLGVALIAGILAGCQGADLMAPGARADRSAATDAAPGRTLTALTWNMYVGTDVDAAFQALLTPDQQDDFVAIQSALATLQATDVSVRVKAIADHVAKYRPHVLGFEEVSSFDVDLSPVGGPVFSVDYLPVLQAALAERGLDYELVSEGGSDVIGPGIDITLSGDFGSIAIRDHDVLLVDADRVTVLAASAHPYSVQFADVVPPGFLPPGIDLVRGWVQARIEVDGTEYTVVDTHMESDVGATSFDGLRVHQASELAATLSAADRLLVMGDLNGRPDSQMHGVLTDASLTDTWAALRPGTKGYTCCHLPDLSDQVGELDQRIDYIFTRGLGRSGPELQGTIDRVGDVPSDRVQGPDYAIWPSDHAGLVATFLSTPVASH